jgi:hypothetical protein
MALALSLSIKIPYRKFPSGDGFTYRAILNTYIGLQTPGAIRSRKIEAIIDSGANDCIFHAQVGESVGFDVKSGLVSETMGVDGKLSTIYFHNMLLYAPGGPIAINAAFSYDLPVVGILGMKGFFEYFKVIFDPTLNRCELDRIYRA